MHDGGGTVVFNGGRHVIGVGAHLVGGSSHGDAEGRPLDHRDVVRAVPDGDGPGGGNTQSRPQLLQAGRLGHAERLNVRPGRPADEHLVTA